MTNPSDPAAGGNQGWAPRQVYGMAVGCLFLGLVIGYLFRGSASPVAHASPVANQQSADSAHAMQSMPTLEQMKEMGDKKAQPLLEQLKTHPGDPALLAQIAGIYKATHQFKDAEDYYGRSLKLDPRNLATRGDLAACLYFTGDIDGAIVQLQKSLKISPADANSLFNLGVIKWQGKKDAPGAVDAWRELLKSNPKLDPAKKNEVEKMIAEIGGANRAGLLRPNDGAQK